MNRGRFLLIAVALAAASQLRAQCGAERRPIKSGWDASAASIDIANPSPTTIATITSLSQPSPIPPATRVTPAETTAWTVDAALDVFKLEGGPKGDHDYHLVLKDDAGHTMIAEIPSPQCTSQGSSAFQEQIAKARADFDAQFTVTTSFQTANIPVRVTGIGMFDFSHGQRGYAANGIELHPVLTIVFNPQGPQPAPPAPGPTPPPPGPSTSNLLGNPGFENGDANPAPWKASPGIISNQNDQVPHAGEWKAWLGGYGTTNTDRLYQDVDVPSASSVTLSFFLHIDTAESGDHPYDTMVVQVRDSANHVLATLATYSNADANVGYEQKTFDLSPFNGRKIRLYLQATEDQASQTSFVVDDFSLTAQ